MNKKIIGYWILTALTAFSMGAGGLMDLIGTKEVVDGMLALGLPAYLCTIIGFYKILGTIAILVPKFPRLKEWAYAGIIIDLTGASACHAFSNDTAGNIITPLVIAAIAMGSWALRPESRRLPG